MSDYNLLPFTFIDDIGREYPIFSIINSKRPDSNGLYIAVLNDEENPPELGNVRAYERLNGFSPKQLKSPDSDQTPSQDSYSEEDLKRIEEEFNGRTVKGLYCGNGYLVPVSGDLEFFEESNEKNNLIFNSYGTIRILIYKNEKFNEYLLPLGEEGDNTDCLIISSEEFNNIVKNIKKMKNGTTII
jgi:hypothetical protein